MFESYYSILFLSVAAGVFAGVQVTRMLLKKINRQDSDADAPIVLLRNRSIPEDILRSSSALLSSTLYKSECHLLVHLAINKSLEKDDIVVATTLLTFKTTNVSDQPVTQHLIFSDIENDGKNPSEEAGELTVRSATGVEMMKSVISRNFEPEARYSIKAGETVTVEARQPLRRTEKNRYTLFSSTPVIGGIEITVTADRALMDDVELLSFYPLFERQHIENAFRRWTITPQHGATFPGHVVTIYW